MALHGGLAPGVMEEDQHEALADTTELTDMVHLVHPNRIRTVNPWIRKQKHCILALSYQFSFSM